MSNQPTGLAVNAQGVEKSFGDWPVLWGLDLALNWGQLIVLLGPNGSGKTTLLRVLSTQVTPDSGRVTVAGFDCRKQANQVRRRVGFVGHRSLLHDDLTCQENLVFYSRLFGLPDPRQRSGEVLELVGLAHRAGHRVRTLSHGMQKRVSIARALLHRPQILLMDEPESGLDAESRAMLKNLVADWTGSGRTVLMTTHNGDLAAEMTTLVTSSRTGHMQHGKVHFLDDDALGSGDGIRDNTVPVPEHPGQREGSGTPL